MAGQDSLCRQLQPYLVSVLRAMNEKCVLFVGSACPVSFSAGQTQSPSCLSLVQIGASMQGHFSMSTERTGAGIFFVIVALSGRSEGILTASRS